MPYHLEDCNVGVEIDGEASMQLAVIGAGHVGTVCAACLSAIGHKVAVLDIDEQRIDMLRTGQVPFVEPSLDALLSQGQSRDLLSFHTDPGEALRGAGLIFLCVNTDNGPDGSVDISPIESAVAVIARSADRASILVNRSTSPVGSAEYIRSLIEELRGETLQVAVNPEFLAEGSAVRDFLMPDRILFGAWEDGSIALLTKAYEPILRRRLPDEVKSLVRDDRQGFDEVPLVITDPASAELAKYAANSFLAMKISFINEMASIAEEVGADVTKIADAVGLDHRIGPHFLKAGVGWGGSCFPKDIVALQGMAETRGLPARMLHAAHDVNAEQRLWTLRKLQRHLKTLFGRRVALLGLSFKPDTDDIRNAPALEIAAELSRANVHVRAFDPVVKTIPPNYPGKITLGTDPVSTVQDADALVVVTEWPQFADLDLHRLRAAMRTPLFLDGRNSFDPETVRAAGFTYVGVGRDAPRSELAPRERANPGETQGSATWPTDALSQRDALISRDPSRIALRP